MGKTLVDAPPGIGRCREGGQHVVVEKMGERAVPDIMQEPGDAESLDDQSL